MTLKEQENIVNEVKKENFGLKLKIHFPEDSLRKCGPGYNEAALKENTELKVDKVTLQKELHRYRMIFGAAERELEQHDKEIEAQELRGKQEGAGQQQEVIERLRESLSELEFDLREKDRIIEEVKEDRLEALGEKEKAEEKLNELREEMANKSFSTKGLSRQLEEKARKIQDELECLRGQHAALRVSFDKKVREARKAQDRIEELGGENEVREQRLKNDLEMTRHELDVANRERTTLSTQLQRLSDELQAKAEEKSLLRTRHDSLSSESSSLQKELSQTKAVISVLENENKLALVVSLYSS
ncbi:MAG: hypothetical protein M1840_002284 [Geoglossum simile]|nr:MAG: hypothetical protein M1840_002284 [Geoglossum simile]